jgi:hypothetical protein
MRVSGAIKCCLSAYRVPVWLLRVALFTRFSEPEGSVSVDHRGAEHGLVVTVRARGLHMPERGRNLPSSGFTFCRMRDGAETP